MEDDPYTPAGRSDEEVYGWREQLASHQPHDYQLWGSAGGHE
jgi:hypothetical protein